MKTAIIVLTGLSALFYADVIAAAKLLNIIQPYLEVLK